MKKIIYSLIKNRKITLFFVFAIIAAGIFGFIENPKQESPDFSIPYAMITTVFPGASQTDVDAYVTAPIEDAIKKIEGYDSSFSYSSNSLSLVMLELKFSADRDESFRALNEAMLTLQKSLPENCSAINVNTDITNTAGILLCLSSESLSNEQVVLEAEFIKDKLDEIDGFESFEIIGKTDSVLSVKINETAMKSSGLSYNQVTALINAGNTDIPIGKVKEGDSSFTVDYIGGYENKEDIENLEIGYSSELNKIIRIKDIADVEYETAALNTYYSYNGNSAVIIAGYFEDGINTLPLKDKINDKLGDIENELSDEIETSLIISQPEEIDSSLIDFLKNLLIAVGLVVMVVLVGMGLRNAVVVSISLPLSVLMAFGAMILLGIKIHQISIAGLIISLGMLVDNSIVVSDSIQGFLDSGVKRKKACMLGVKSVAVPILTSTLTTIAAFMPFLFLNSIAGDYIKALPQIVSISLVASYITAILIIPVVGYIFFKPRKNKARKKRLNIFKRLIKSSMDKKAFVMVVVLLLAAGSVFLTLELDTIFFPASDKNIVYIDIRNNNSDDIQGTQNIVSDIFDILDEEDGILEYTAAAGGGLPRFNKIMYIYTKTPDIGQIMIRIDLEKAGHDTNEEYKSALQSKLDDMNLDAKITVKELMYAFPMDEDLKIRIVGDSLSDLKDYETQIYTLLKSNSGLINVNQGNTKFIDVYNMSVSSEKAATFGLLPAEIQNEISIAMLGRVSSSIRKDGYETPISVSGKYNTVSDLKSIPLLTTQGTYIVANDVIDLKKTSALSTIPRYKGDYALTLTADYNLEYDKKGTLDEIKDGIEALDFESASIIYDGEDVLIKENFGQVGVLGIIALVIVFMILMIQFKSFLMPLIIFITIPLSAIGSILGLYITGQPISFTALLGIVSLLGIVVNNAIILIDYIKKEQSSGIKVKKACINASIRRLRPILLSTITTVIGLIPLAISNSDLFRPMAIALMSGLLVSTLLTLIVLPVLVSIVKKEKAF